MKQADGASPILKFAYILMRVYELLGRFLQGIQRRHTKRSQIRCKLAIGEILLSCDRSIISAHTFHTEDENYMRNEHNSTRACRSALEINTGMESSPFFNPDYGEMDLSRYFIGRPSPFTVIRPRSVPDTNLFSFWTLISANVFQLEG
jgi:hypothetical protein